MSVFCGFAWGLRGVTENFHIVSELRRTGTVGILSAIPWVIFTQVHYLQDNVNNLVFPFSTLCLIVAIAAAFTISTLFPLYYSIFESHLATRDFSTTSTGDLSSLRGIISSPAGFAAFREFLTKEFSVENILFYAEVEKHREKLREYDLEDEIDNNKELALHEDAKAIWQQYIVQDSISQVNLPSNIVRNVETALNEEFDRVIAAAAANREEQLAAGGTGMNGNNTLNGGSSSSLLSDAKANSIKSVFRSMKQILISTKERSSFQASFIDYFSECRWFRSVSYGASYSTI